MERSTGPSLDFGASAGAFIGMMKTMRVPGVHSAPEASKARMRKDFTVDQSDTVVTQVSSQEACQVPSAEPFLSSGRQGLVVRLYSTT